MAQRAPTHAPENASATCVGEKCAVCREPATHKVSEEILFDEPQKPTSMDGVCLLRALSTGVRLPRIPATASTTHA